MQISASSNDERLKYDVILCSLGTRYNSYCANLGRTLLVDPSKQQEAEYKCGMMPFEAIFDCYHLLYTLGRTCHTLLVDLASSERLSTRLSPRTVFGSSSFPWQTTTL